MNKRCPPGVICLENITMFFIMIIVVAVIYFVYNSVHEEKRQERRQDRRIENRIRDPNESYFGFFSRPNYSFNNYSNDVLLNPYVPPLSDERYIVPNISYIPPGTMPINISTNVGAVNTNYRQMGLLTPLNNSGKLLPLMGRPLYTNRNKWQYYTMSDQNNSIKLPIVKNGRSCTNEYGCDEIYGGDNVFVEGYNQAFKVTIYDSNSINYLPFI